MRITWNLTALKNKHSRADVIVLSIGKSGRTWLRVLLNKFLSLHFHLPFGLEDLSNRDSAVPVIEYSHELWKHFSEATISQRLRGKYLIPLEVLRSKKVVLLFRDPRDVVVSMYFQKTRRSHNRISCTISEFVRQRRWGIRNMVRVMNEWRERLKDHPQCLWVSYESMKADTTGEIARILDFIGIAGVNPCHISEAVDFSRFENMKKMEAGGEFQKKSLRPGDLSDADSFKVREGKVGGFKRHFSEADLAYIDQAMQQLNPFYGYSRE